MTGLRPRSYLFFCRLRALVRCLERLLFAEKSFGKSGSEIEQPGVVDHAGSAPGFRGHTPERTEP
jgi:hypothetical protein